MSSFLISRFKAGVHSAIQEFRKGFYHAATSINVVCGTLDAAPTAVVKDCRIDGTLIVEAGAVVHSCYVPYNSVVRVGSMCIVMNSQLGDDGKPKDTDIQDNIYIQDTAFVLGCTFFGDATIGKCCFVFGSRLTGNTNIGDSSTLIFGRITYADYSANRTLEQGTLSATSLGQRSLMYDTLLETNGDFNGGDDLLLVRYDNILRNPAITLSHKFDDYNSLLFADSRDTSPDMVIYVRKKFSCVGNLKIFDTTDFKGCANIGQNVTIMHDAEDFAFNTRRYCAYIFASALTVGNDSTIIVSETGARSYSYYESPKAAIRVGNRALLFISGAFLRSGTSFKEIVVPGNCSTIV